MRLRLDAVAVDQGAFKARYDLELEGDAVALFGPSGCGKTTLLEAVAGLRPCSGRIRLDDRVLLDSRAGICVPARQRGIGYVPQDLALFPHLDVAGNLGYGRAAGAAGPSLAVVAEALGLAARLTAGVGQLSGGERRRVALGRALLARPALLLLDEPCANLDAGLRRRVAALLRDVGRRFGVPLLLVSHDAAEIRGLGCQVALLKAGRCLRVRGPVASGRMRGRR